MQKCIKHVATFNNLRSIYAFSNCTTVDSLKATIPLPLIASKNLHGWKNSTDPRFLRDYMYCYQKLFLFVLILHFDVSKEIKYTREWQRK